MQGAKHQGKFLLMRYSTTWLASLFANVARLDPRSCHPGWVDPPAVEEAYGSKKKFLEPMRNGWQGAEGIAWLMSTNQVRAAI